MAITTVSSHVVSVNAIQGTLIADNAITAVHIATNAVSGTLIADNAVTATHIAQNTITVTQIADDAITAPKLADGIITTNHLNKAMISSQTEVTAVAGDFLLIGDTSDSNNLKKIPISGITALATVSGISSSADATAITIDSSENVGIGETTPLGKLHVKTADSGASADSGADELVVEGSGDSGIQILSGTSNNSTILFGDSGDSAAGRFRYEHNNNALNFGTNGAWNKMYINSSGNVGIGTTSPQSILHLNSANAELRVTTSGDNEVARLTLAEDSDGDTHGAFLEYRGNDSDKTVLGVMNAGTETDVITYKDDGKVGIGTTDPKSTLQVEGGRMGIISTSSSWEQLRIANSSAAEVGIALLNGATNTEFLSDDVPSFSNAFTLAINPYGVGADTLAIGHGNLGDSIWHIDGSGNFGFGPNTENPLTYYEISKNRPDVNAPSDYELKMTLNTYGYVGNGYKLAMLQFVGGDTASAQDNFYAGIGSTALTGSNNSEEGSIDFHVRNGISTTETLAMQIIGKAGTGVAGSGQHGKSVLFPYQGIAIDRIWANYPGISVLNDSDYGSSLQGEFRFHGTNSSSDAYPGTSGSDFSVDVRADGSFISTSDRRAKTNITTITDALSTVKQITGKRFQRVNRENEAQKHLSKNGYKFGFIAQEVENIIPEAIKYNADEDDGTESWNSAYAMDYGSVVALLVNAIKEQDTVIQDLKSRIETLEG